MKIKKNGKVINLTESDLKLIVNRVLSEQFSDEDNDGFKNYIESYGKDPDFDVAIKFASSVENWWINSGDIFNTDKNPDYIKFFKPFNKPMNDLNDAAAIEYKKKVINDLNNEVGKDNIYYEDLKDWIYDILVEIQDPLFQSVCPFELESKDGRKSKHTVDPEIDV